MKKNPAQTNTVFEAKNITKIYGQKPVLRGVSLTVHPGEIVGLLGPNGAGKTTCFYIMSGLVSPNDGHVFLESYDVTNFPLYQRARLGISYLPQESSVFGGLNVEDNIRVALENLELSYEEQEQRLDELLAEFSISHLRKSSSLSLSGGERRRLEIARALASHPKFVLFDEPLAGIDPLAINDIRQIIFLLKKKGIGVLITDHNVRETLDIVDRAYVLHDGLVLTEGSAEFIIDHQDVKRVYLGSSFNA